MKKVLLVSSLLLASMSSAFAQVPDASGWNKGDEITEQVGLGNPNFTNMIRKLNLAKFSNALTG